MLKRGRKLTQCQTDEYNNPPEIKQVTEYLPSKRIRATGLVNKIVSGWQCNGLSIALKEPKEQWFEEARRGGGF
jgi:hypothetical protein